MPRFTIGERVEPNGVLAELYSGAIGTVVAVVPNKDGVTELDEYTVAFGSREVTLRDFQLTHVEVPPGGEAA